MTAVFDKKKRRDSDTRVEFESREASLRSRLALSTDDDDWCANIGSLGVKRTWNRVAERYDDKNYLNN